MKDKICRCPYCDEIFILRIMVRKRGSGRQNVFIEEKKQEEIRTGIKWHQKNLQ